MLVKVGVVALIALLFVLGARSQQREEATYLEATADMGLTDEDRIAWSLSICRRVSQARDMGDLPRVAVDEVTEEAAALGVPRETTRKYIRAAVEFQCSDLIDRLGSSLGPG